MIGCTFPGCPNKHLAKGLCRAHYLRNWKRGSTEKLTMRGAPILERIMAKITVTGSGCWIFKGSMSEHGYGQIRDGGKMRGAHIVTYEKKYGAVPEGRELDHFFCKTPACCNPDHVEPVPHVVNVRRGNAGRNWVDFERNECGQFLPIQKGLI